MASFRYFVEHPDNPYRLGRHRVPDAFEPAKLARPRRDAIRSVTHKEFVPCWDQGNLGSCTANAALGCLVTEPFGHEGVSYTEDDAVALYSLESRIDDSQIPGHYPPLDQGSTGPWSMKALEQEGKIKDFVHTTDMHTALQLLNDGPISIGVTWFASMFNADETDTIHVEPESGVAGGHQVCVVGNDVENQRVLIRNSWSSGWGLDGHAWMSWGDLSYLFSGGAGDAVQPRM